MTDDGAKSVSPRGSFIIGLVLGAGLGCLFAFFQNQRFEGELRRLASENEILLKRAANAQGEALALKAQLSAR